MRRGPVGRGGRDPRRPERLSRWASPPNTRRTTGPRTQARYARLKAFSGWAPGAARSACSTRSMSSTRSPDCQAGQRSWSGRRRSPPATAARRCQGRTASGAPRPAGGAAAAVRKPVGQQQRVGGRARAGRARRRSPASASSAGTTSAGSTTSCPAGTAGRSRPATGVGIAGRRLGALEHRVAEAVAAVQKVARGLVDAPARGSEPASRSAPASVRSGGALPQPQLVPTSASRRTRSGCRTGELLGHHAAERVADDVDALVAELVEQPAEQLCHDGQRQRDRARARPAGARRVEDDRPRALGEPRARPGPTSRRCRPGR